MQINLRKIKEVIVSLLVKKVLKETFFSVKIKITLFKMNEYDLNFVKK